MAYFENAEEMIREAEVLIRENADESTDEAILTGFYNGKDLCESQTGFSGNQKNHLMGFDSMNDARLQLERIYTGQKLVWRIALPNARPQDRQRWEMQIENKLNAIIKASHRFKPQWKGLCGMVTLMGRGVLVHTDKYDWCPEMMRPLVPIRTGTLADDVPYAVIPGSMTIRDLNRYLVSARKNPDTSWKIAAVEATIRMLSENVGTEMTSGTNAFSSNITPAEAAEMAPKGTGAELRTTILVFHVYENCTEDDGSKYVKHTIIARHGEDMRSRYQEGTGKRMPMMLYQDEYFADAPEEWLHPYFIDCKIGKTTTWHNVMGLGRLNYEADVEAEVFMNEVVQGSKEQLRRLYTVESNADMEAMQQFLSGDRAGNILPEGLKAAEVTKNPGFQYAMQTMGLMRNISAAHSKSSVPNSQESSDRELEVNAIERQGRAALSLSARIGDFYDDTDRLGTEIVRRFLTIEPLPTDRAYSEIKEFQDFLKERKIPISILREKGEDGGLLNIQVATGRTMGQGDRVTEVMTNRMLMSRFQFYSPQAQQMILRQITASETGDHDLAEALVPETPKTDPQQIERANSENQACVLRGITGYVPQIQADDMPMYHIQEHMGGLEGMLAKGQAQGWEPVDAGAFKALGAHTAAHIQQIMADKNQKNTGRQLMGRLQQFASAADQLVKAMEQKQADQELTASEQVRFRQADQKLQLAERKEENVVRNRRDTLALKEAELASRDVAAGEKLRIDRGKLENDIFKTDSANALELHNSVISPVQVPPAPGGDGAQ